MAEQKKEALSGETIIGDDVVASVAGMAAREVEGVASLGKSAVRRALAEHLAGAGERARVGVEVEVGKMEAIVDLELIVIYGFNIPSVITEVRKKVTARLMEIAGLIAKEINVHVVGIEVPERKETKVK